MKHQNEGGTSADHVGQQTRHPKRPVSVEPLAQEVGGCVEQLPIVAWGRPFPLDQMPVKVEVGIIDPHRPAAAERNPPQSLPQPKDGRYPFDSRERTVASDGPATVSKCKMAPMFIGTEPRSVTRTVTSMGPIRSIRPTSNCSVDVSTITSGLASFGKRLHLP
jgi:hypothetical protein